ncbi:17622_t:CDS:2 [Funneliformis geosporum]|nr:17622_t:CDS:2 [Funneliformis geosporum]
MESSSSITSIIDIELGDLLHVFCWVVFDDVKVEISVDKVVVYADNEVFKEFD